MAEKPHLPPHEPEVEAIALSYPEISTGVDLASYLFIFNKCTRFLRNNGAALREIIAKRYIVCLAL